MHLLSTSSVSFDDIVEPVDLRQQPADVAVLSFTDSDLAGVASAWAAHRNALPSICLTQLRDLRHPMSVDLWIDRVGAHARVIVVRLLGGLDWWRYGIDRLASLARERSIALAVLPGEDRDDPRLAEVSTLPPDELALLLRYFREGGTENMLALLRRLGRGPGDPGDTTEPLPLPRAGGYLPGFGVADLDRLGPEAASGRPVIPIIFYRSALLAADVAPIDALCAALRERGLFPAPLFVASLKDRESNALLREAFARLNPAVVVTTTAFTATGDSGAPTVLDSIDAPVLQAVMATTKLAAWTDSVRGLGSADLAMNVVLPELDGRVMAGVISFKNPMPAFADLAFTGAMNCPEPAGIAAVADRVAALVRLQRTPAADRKIAILLPDYPGARGRAGYAVGLDVSASAVAMLSDLADAGYGVVAAPTTTKALIEAVNAGPTSLSLDRYGQLLAALPGAVRDRMEAAWGPADSDPDVVDGAFRFRACVLGHVIVAFPPDRGRRDTRRSDYHDPALPPRHALVAFSLWLRHIAEVHALVHLGAHGTLEWVPGKTVALTPSCFPSVLVGALPVIYPFIVNNPGEAAQAKRRIGAITIGHLPPPLTRTALAGDARELERLVDEFAQADGLDARRRDRLARMIVEEARRSGLAVEAGVNSDAESDEALRRIDAWLCDLKDLSVKDGQHVFGRAPVTGDGVWTDSAACERRSLLDALAGRRVRPGPAGSPHRHRRDVLPTGRNLFAADPRTLPTQTATDTGRLAANEILVEYMQTHGEMPRALVIDLWGSATLRTGGEEIAQGLALMGCRPLWDRETGRVSGVEVLPCAVLGRPRVDVTWRISGLFRDLFPAQIALIDAAVRAVAAREEPDDENPLACARRAGNESDKTALARIFGTAPGAYGAGLGDLPLEASRDDIGAAYLDATSHIYGGVDSEGEHVLNLFSARVAAADLLVHVSDDPDRDLLEGSEDAAFVGGFAAAAAKLGQKPDLVMLDMTDPGRPRARSLSRALARIVRARAVNPEFIEGQMRHGSRGAAELAETVDRLVDFARATDAVSSVLFDLLYDAYVANDRVRAFLMSENPEAAASMGARLEQARQRGLWHPRRNDIEAGLTKLRAEAAP